MAERLKPESVYQAFVKHREALGMEMLPLTEGVSSFAILTRRLRAGRLVCIVADRDLTGTGIEVSFFGEKAKFPAAAAVMAVHTGAALMPVATWFEGNGDWGCPHLRGDPGARDRGSQGKDPGDDPAAG